MHRARVADLPQSLLRALDDGFLGPAGDKEPGVCPLEHRPVDCAGVVFHEHCARIVREAELAEQRLTRTQSERLAWRG